MRKIAAEEAFSIPEVADTLAELVSEPIAASDYHQIKAIYGEGSTSPVRAKLCDLEEDRLAEMDAHGVDMHLLSLSSPGVQMFGADAACALAELANDRLADVVHRRPERFAGLAAFAPQTPRRAAVEMRRSIDELHLHGFLVNSHTNDEYLDDPKYWPILEAAEGLDRCLYIHPRCASSGLAEPLRAHGLLGAIWGFGLEVGTHVLRLILSGTLDRFPDLSLCIGHMGEAIPFWQWRIDDRWRSAPVAGASKLELTPSEYLKRNVVITTSGVEDPLALDYSIKALGAERVLWAIDHPFQRTATAVSFMDRAPVTDDQREMLYHRNAERVFHIS